MMRLRARDQLRGRGRRNGNRGLPSSLPRAL